MAELNYVVYDGQPAIHDGREAWVIYNEKAGWKRIDVDEVIHEGGIMTRAKWREMLDTAYPNAPDLPTDAFGSRPT
jgi:hypothetical protein